MSHRMCFISLSLLAWTMFTATRLGQQKRKRKKKLILWSPFLVLARPHSGSPMVMGQSKEKAYATLRYAKSLANEMSVVTGPTVKDWVQRTWPSNPALALTHSWRHGPFLILCLCPYVARVLHWVFVRASAGSRATALSFSFLFFSISSDCGWWRRKGKCALRANAVLREGNDFPRSGFLFLVPAPP